MKSNDVYIIVILFVESSKNTNKTSRLTVLYKNVIFLAYSLSIK